MLASRPIEARRRPTSPNACPTGFLALGGTGYDGDAARLGASPWAARRRLRRARLADRIERLLVRRCLDRIGLARRTGQAVAGADRVADALARGLGRGGVLIEAADTSPAGREKIERLAEGATVVDLFTADEIGAVFGRERTMHALITAGGHADAFRADAARLGRFRHPAAKAA